MKVVAFNGSPRRGGNTSQLIRIVLDEMEKEGIATELIELAGSNLHGCTACYTCKQKQNGQCVITKDALNEYVQKMIEADGIILGSPTYFTDVTSEMKALIDRGGFVTRSNDCLLKRKVGAAVVSVRRGGAVHTFDTLNHFFLISQMIVAGSTYWNFGMGLNPGDVLNDEEGVKTMQVLGQNMAWLLKKVRG